MNLSRSLFTASLASFTALAIAACSSSDGDASATSSADLTSTSALEATLKATGFTTGTGKFAFLDISACCDTTCAGNNPSSPYATFDVPPAPGEAPEADADPNGLSNNFHFREDEAIVFVGQTPPSAKYFGFTPYLSTRAGLIFRHSPSASLSETLNQLVIGVDAPQGSSVFGQRTAVVAAADQQTLAKVTASLVASGIPSSAINTLVLDPAVSHFGLYEAADTFSVLFRVALPDDPTALAAYIANPPAVVYRLTPKAVSKADPLPSPVARPKNTTNNENTLLTDPVNALGQAIVSAYPGYTSEELPVSDGVPDPAACIAGQSICAFDNRDTTYPGTQQRLVWKNDDDFYIVYGVNHVVTKKTVYSNVSAYGLEKLYGMKSVASTQYGASGALYGAVPSSGSLYSYKIARSCGTEPYCVEIPAGSCPTGLDDDKLGSFAFRTYLEPSSKTAPSPDMMLRDRIKYFHH